MNSIRQDRWRLGRRCAAALLALLWLGACQGPAPTPEGSDPQAPPSLAGPSHRLLPDASTLLLRVSRAGPLARLGHNHVITHADLAGEAAPAAQGGWDVRLRVAVADFVVDDPTARAAQPDDFADTTPDAEAIAATRANMLGPDLLDAARHPWIVIDGHLAEADAEQARLRIRLQGRSYTRMVPVRIQDDGAQVRVRGELTLSLEALDLAFSALGGALRVADAVPVSFDLRFAARP